MTPHTDAGEMLKLADEIERACKAPHYEARLGTIEGKMVVAILRQAASQGREGDEAVPAREAFWLVERLGTGLYVKRGPGDLTDNVWHAHRFDGERDAFDYARLSEAPWARDLRATEHMFINKVDAALSPPVKTGGGEQSEVRSEVVAWQKRRNDYARGEWIQVLPEHVDEAKRRGWQVRPLYAAPQPAIAAQAALDPDKTAKEIVSKWIGDCGGYLDLTFIQSELLQERIREYLPPASSVPSASIPAQARQERHEATYLRGWNEGIECAVEALEKEGWYTPQDTIRKLVEASPVPSAEGNSHD